MSDPLGRDESVKKALIAMLNSAVSGNPYFAHVSGDWSNQTRLASRLPYITVRLGPTVPSDELYGMLLQSNNDDLVEGRFEDKHFTLHLFTSGCSEAGEEENRYVHQLKDAIVDYLDAHRFEQSSSEIADIAVVSDRESIPEGLPRNVKRMIIEGKMWTRRTQELYYPDMFPYELPFNLE